jgi:hypothetical protein
MADYARNIEYDAPKRTMKRQADQAADFDAALKAANAARTRALKHRA